jgi:citrate lyase subunit beta / citryl-CoA lyase
MDLLRSLLLVPALDADALDAARASHADAIVLDLAGDVPVQQAEAAREAARAAAATLRSDHRRVWVKVHPTGTTLARADIRATICEQVAGYVVPNAQSQNHLRYTETLLRDAESANDIKEGTLRLIAVIESATGLLNAREIAGASSRLAALALDGAGYCGDMGVELMREGNVLQHPRSHIAVCARAANITAIDTPYLHTRETQGLLADVTTARALGMHGKFVISAGQVVVVNAVFRPSSEEIAYARRLEIAHKEAEERGDDYAHLDGRIIDAPRAKRAQRLVELATAIEAKEQQAAV